jgi:hypothetical protein
MTQILHCLLARKDIRTDLTEKHASHPVSHAVFRLMFTTKDLTALEWMVWGEHVLASHCLQGLYSEDARMDSNHGLVYQT